MIKPRKSGKLKAAPRRSAVPEVDTASNDPIAAQARILSAARREFIERGLGGARMRAIAIEAKVNSALLHYYFRNKQNLYEAALIDTVASVWGQLKFQTLPNSTPSELPDLLRGMMRLYLRNVLGQPDFARFMLREILDGGRHIPLVQKTVAANLGVFFQSLISGLGHAADEGRMRRIHPVDAVLNLAGMAIASVIFVLVSEHMENPMIQNFRKAPDFQERRVEEIVTTFFDGLKVTA